MFLIANSRTSGYVAIGGSAGGCSTITNGNLLCHNGINLDRSTNYINCDGTATNKKLFNSLTTGYIDFCMNLTTGYMNMCKTFVMSPDNITYNNSGTTFNLFNNLLSTVTMNIGGAGNIILCNSFKTLTNKIEYTGTGTCEICANIPNTQSLYLGGVGNIKVGNVFTFKSADIISSGINDVINVFNNITTGTINFCNGLTTGILQIGAGKFNFGTYRIYGYTEFVTTSVNYTIVSTSINKEFFLEITGGNPRTITFPARKVGQIIYIRNNTVVSQLLTCVGSSGGFYPTQTGGGYFNPAWSFPTNSSQ